MTSLITSPVGYRILLLLVLMSGALMVQSFTVNDVLSSSDVDHQPSEMESSDLVDYVIDVTSSLSASSMELSSIDYDAASDPVDDSSYVPSVSEDSFSIPDSEDASYMDSSHSTIDLSEIDEQSMPDVHDPSYVPSDDDDAGSLSSDSSSLSSSSTEGESASDPHDPSYVPSDDSGSLSSISNLTVEVEPTLGEKKMKRVPASLDLNRQPEGNTHGDNGGTKTRGRPASVFNGPHEKGVTRGEGHGRRLVPSGSGDGSVTPNGKPSKGGSMQHGKGSPSNRPDRQWGGPPSPHRQKELRAADTTYLDLFLCGQFLPGSADSVADDFAVVSFNYAGRTQPFSPCSALGSTAETVNYVHRTMREDVSAFQQVLDDLPDTWQRYQSEKGVAPRVVHVFTYNMLESVAAASTLLRLRRTAPYRSARFVLGYLNQPSPAGDLSTDSARLFIDLLNALDKFEIETVRVCGRCAKVAGSSGRRRAAMQFGMSAVSDDSMNSQQCHPIQEHAVPGADLVKHACDGFQKSVTRCVLRSIQRRCPEIDFASGRTHGVDTDEDLLHAVDTLARQCSVESDCWRRQGELIRQFVVPKKENRCSMSVVDLGKMLGRCSSASAGLPFDV